MTTAASYTNRGSIEGDRLTRALINMASRGERCHCSDATLSELWLSDHESERAEACRLCRGCPVLLECRAVGKHQTFGVYGGVDVTRRPRKKRPIAPAQYAAQQAWAEER